MFQGSDARDAAAKKHAFWDNQPMPNKFNEAVAEEPVLEMIDNQIAVNVSPNPVALDETLELEWCDDVWRDAPLESICREVFALSRAGESQQVTSFSPDVSFLMWSMNPPGMMREWLVGVRRRKAPNELVGFICGLPMSASIGGVVIEKVMEIKNLYVHPVLRGNRITPILISEVSRRVRRSNFCVALYTSSVTITRPLCKARFYQRPLNMAKLAAARFKDATRGQTLPRLARRYSECKALPAGWMKFEERHVEAAWRLLQTHLSAFTVHQILSLEEFRFWFGPKKHPSVHAYVVESNNGQVEAFCAWHVMEASAISNAGRPMTLRAAFSHYNAGSDLALIMQAQVAQLLKDDVDVSMWLDIGGNEEELLDFESSRAEVTSEYLLYHLYNFRARPCDDCDQFKVCFF